MTDTATPTDTRTDYQLDQGDHDRFAHITVTPGQDGEAVVLEAMVTGTPITALCGKRFVPQRDPKKYPVCPPCAEKRAILLGGNGHDDDDE